MTDFKEFTSGGWDFSDLKSVVMDFGPDFRDFRSDLKGFRPYSRISQDFRDFTSNFRVFKLDFRDFWSDVTAVSYTHLTLPTKRIV